MSSTIKLTKAQLIERIAALEAEARTLTAKLEEAVLARADAAGQASPRKPAYARPAQSAAAIAAHNEYQQRLAQARNAAMRSGCSVKA